MRLKHIYITSILLTAIVVFTACSKKERSPKLLVHVIDVNKTKIEGATVHVWPTDKLHVDSLSSGVPNPSVDQTRLTDANGDAAFEYEFSAVLDIDVTYLKITSDTSSEELVGHRVVKIETVKQKSEENLFEETIIIK